MANPAARSLQARSNHPVALEFAAVGAVVLCLYLWQRLVGAAVAPTIARTLPADEFLLVALVSGGVLVGGVAMFAAAYATLRGISVGRALPARADLPLAGAALLVPAGLVGLAGLVGRFTGVPLDSLTKTGFAAEGGLPLFLRVAALTLVVAVPFFVVVCQVLLQGSFRRAVGGDAAVALTALAAGFALSSNSGGLSIVLDRGKVAGAVVFVLALVAAAVGTRRAGRRWLRVLALVPLLLFLAVVVLDGVATVGSVAAGLYAAAQVAALAVAAYAYDRTDSLLVPALAYASLFLAEHAVVFLFEAGLRGW